MKGLSTGILKYIFKKIKPAAKIAASVMAAGMVLFTPKVVSARPEGITATSWVIMDVETGQILDDQLGRQTMYPASITKILTVAMALEKCQNDTSIQLTVSHDAVYSIEPGSSHIALQEGEVVSIADMVYAAMLASGNDAANVLVEYVCGSVSNAEAIFSQKLAELGCTNTHFANGHGLHNENHYTTAEDMAKITRWALTVPGFQEVFSSESYQMQPTNLQPEVRYFSTADWMRLGGKYGYEYARGSKNGWTTPAGQTFVSWAGKDGRQLICVLLNSLTKYVKFSEAAALFEYGFNEFTPVSSDLLATKEISIQGGGDPLGTVTLRARPTTLYLSNAYTADNLRSEIQSPDLYTLGQPFAASIHVWLEDASGATKEVGTYPMEFVGMDGVLTENIGLVPENLAGSGRGKGFDPQLILLYAGILIGGGFAAMYAWKLGKKHAAQLRSTGARYTSKKGIRWPYASVQGPDIFRWRVVKGKKNQMPKVSRQKYVYHKNNGDK